MGSDGPNDPRFLTFRHPCNMSKTSGLISGIFAAALLPLLSLLICFSTLALNAKVVFAQTTSSDVDQKDEGASRFRVELTPVAGGAELITIWARVVDGKENQTEELPLISVLRDTLGDDIKENDILREVWVHTYSQPRLVQRAAALVPFLYKGLQVKSSASSASPPQAIINLSDMTD